MRRREFIAGLGSAAAWPVAARAQQAAMPVIGYLDGGGPPTALSLAAFREGLNEFGYVEGRNLAIEFRVADQYDRLPALALELARLRVAVIVAATSSNSVRAAKAATSTIPIVFVSGGDPVRLGFVGSMNRPGGNITGVSQYTGALVPKRLQFLHELLPRLATIGFLTNPTALASEPDVADVQEAARTLALQLIVLKASTAEQIDAAFATLAQRQVGALLIDTDGFFTTPFQVRSATVQHRQHGGVNGRGKGRGQGL